MTIEDIKKQSKQEIHNLTDIVAGQIARRLRSYNIPAIVELVDTNEFNVIAWCEDTRWRFVLENVKNMYCI